MFGRKQKNRDEQIARGQQVLDEMGSFAAPNAHQYMRGLLRKPSRTQILADCMASNPVPKGFAAPPPSMAEQIERGSKIL